MSDVTWIAIILNLPMLCLLVYGLRVLHKEQSSAIHFHSDFWRDVTEAGRLVMFHPNKLVKGPVGPQGPQGPQGVVGTPLQRKK